MEDVQDQALSIVAPMDLPSGYQFDATVDGKKIEVVVPEGGVEEGDCIFIPLNAIYKNETSDITNKKSVIAIKKENSIRLENNFGKHSDHSNTKNGNGNGKRMMPVRKWRKELLSCFDVICSCLFWLSLIPTPSIVQGQLMQRLKLNFWGCRAENYGNTCITVFIFSLLTLSVEGIMLYLQFQTNNVIFNAIGSAFHVNAMLLTLYWSYKLRSILRFELDLPTSFVHSNECCDDCLVILCCNCCSLIQIARHTHDETVDKYYCCSRTGLLDTNPKQST